MSDAEVDERTHNTEEYHGEYNEHTREDDGRCVKIDTGFYNVQVWGDTDDSFDAVMDKVKEAADRAKEDAVDLDDRIDDDGRHYR